MRQEIKDRFRQFVFVELLVRRRGWSRIGYRCSCNGDVCGWKPLHSGLEHFFGCLDLHHIVNAFGCR